MSIDQTSSSPVKLDKNGFDEVVEQSTRYILNPGKTAFISIGPDPERTVIIRTPKLACTGTLKPIPAFEPGSSSGANSEQDSEQDDGSRQYRDEEDTRDHGQPEDPAALEAAIEGFEAEIKNTGDAQEWQLPTTKKSFTDIVKEYGAPNFATKRNPVGSLNEPFWAALYREEHDILFEPRENDFYEYGGDIYRSVTHHIILDRIADRLRAAALSTGCHAFSQLTASRHINGVIAHLKGQAQKEEAFEKNSKFIHVANGVLELSNGSINLLPFSPQLISRNLIPIRYEPGATCNRFKTELLGLLDVDDRELLQKFLGLFLLGRNIAQKMLILHGLGETGKSTFSILARKLIGVTNCSELRTHLLHERFEIGSYIGKNLLIGADVSSTFLNSRGAYRLKAMVGGDLLDAERKGANYRFQLPGHFNVMVTSNSRLTARLENDRGPWARRLAIVEYEKPRTCKVIPEFAEMLIREEGSGILLFATEGLFKLWADVAAYGSLQLTEKQHQRVESLLDESDGLRLFLQARVTRDPSSSLTTAEIVEAYAAFAMNKGWNMSIGQTEQELPDLMMEMFQVAKSHNVPSLTTGKGVRGYWGVRFI